MSDEKRIALRPSYWASVSGGKLNEMEEENAEKKRT